MREKCREGALVDNKYRILRRIGNGGTSAVYLARHARTGKLWAIKEIRSGTKVSDTVARNSLNAEIEILKHLEHPLLPRIVDVVEDAHHFYVIMDYFPGRTLEELVEVTEGTDRKKTIEIGLFLCDVLHYLHTRKPPIIYRDLKPGNIILNPDGEIRLIDFGAAVQYGHVSDEIVCDGTPAYASPEQRKGFADARSDIYCLGRTLYHLFTGKRPNGELPEVSDAGLNRIIKKCTMYDPRKRYNNCQEVARDLRQLRLEDNSAARRTFLKGAAVFVALAVASVCTLMGVTQSAKKKEAAASYQAYIDASYGNVTEAEKVSALRNAIQCDPKREEAYLALLERVYLADGVYSGFEDASFLEIINTKGPDGKEPVLSLEEGSDGRDYLDYRMGLAYFYCYEGNGNKNLAYPYLKAAAESTRLSEERRELSSTLLAIASYYAQLTRPEASGDQMVGYEDYWKDLNDCLQKVHAGADNATTTLMVCEETLYQIHMNAARFKADGIAKEELLQALRLTEEILMNTQVEEAADLSLALAAKRLTLSDTIDLAKTSVAATFPEGTKTHVDQAMLWE